MTWASKILSERGTAGTPYFSAFQNRLALMWTSSRDASDLQLESLYSFTNEELVAGKTFSLSGPYEIGDMVSYLGVYKG